jgi:hypothetical protein
MSNHFHLVVETPQPTARRLGTRRSPVARTPARAAEAR